MVAVDTEDLIAAYRLVHDVYVESGYIEPHLCGARFRTFELSRYITTFIEKDKNGDIIGVMSLIEDSGEFGLPSDEAFGFELSQFRDDGKRLYEISNLVSLSYRTVLSLAKECKLHLDSIDFDVVFIAISPEHSKSFSRFFGFIPIGTPRNCSGSNMIEDIVQGMIAVDTSCRYFDKEKSK